MGSSLTWRVMATRGNEGARILALLQIIFTRSLL